MLNMSKNLILIGGKLSDNMSEVIKSLIENFPIDLDLAGLAGRLLSNIVSKFNVDPECFITGLFL